jgi:phosphoribosylformylglycinamidine (FGAM) synthase-like amidotransferase family enzyme
MDPFGTGNQAGTCTLNLYGGFSTGATTVSTYAVPSVAAGTVWTNNLQTIANGFQGYIIGVCNFQYAHGYGAITDTGVRNFISSYLALVMNNGTLTTRGTQAENFNQ